MPRTSAPAGWCRPPLTRSHRSPSTCPRTPGNEGKISKKNNQKINIPQSVPYHIWSPRTFGTACPENGNSQLQFAENFNKIPEHLGIQSCTLFHICPEKKQPVIVQFPSSKLNHFEFTSYFVSHLSSYRISHFSSWTVVHLGS